jgi:hypothetical protein
MNSVSHGPESVGTLLKRTHPELLISKYRLKQAEGIHLVRQRREQGNQLLGFNSRPFVLCGLPLRRPPPGQLLYERRNGNFVLQVTGHPAFGLPFGQDRLVPIFLATMAVRQQSKTIRFKSASVLLETFGMAKGGKEYRRVVAAFERIFGATMFFGTEPASTPRVIHRARFNFLSEATLWYQRDSAGENVITLSEEFFAEVMAHPIPADLEAVKVLVAAPGVLDLFMWLSYRCFTAKGQESIPLFGPAGLTHQIGCVDYSRPRRFRAMLDQWLTTIRAVWPECPARISACRSNLIVGHKLAICPDPRTLRAATFTSGRGASIR